MGGEFGERGCWQKVGCAEALWLVVGRGLLKGKQSLEGLGGRLPGELGTETAEGLGGCVEDAALDPGSGGRLLGPHQGPPVCPPAAYLEHPSQASSLRDSKNSASTLSGFKLCCCDVSVTQSHSFPPTWTGSQLWGPVWAGGPWSSYLHVPGAGGHASFLPF